MRFRLDTLLIVVAAIAVLMSQYPFFTYRTSAGVRRFEGFSIGFTAVGLAELVLLIGWACTKRPTFPWKRILWAAIVLHPSLVLLSMWITNRKIDAEFVWTVVKGFAIFVALGVAAVYIAYWAIIVLRAFAMRLRSRWRAD